MAGLCSNHLKEDVTKRKGDVESHSKALCGRSVCITSDETKTTAAAGYNQGAVQIPKKQMDQKAVRVQNRTRTARWQLVSAH